MASIYSSSETSSLSIYNSLTSSNKGIGGLVSGLNTDELVEAMVAGTRNKIAAQNQLKTTWQWKQSAYRTVAEGLRALQNKYLDSVNGANNHIGMNAFWNVYNASSTNENVATVTAGSSATSGTYVINSVEQLATATQLTIDDYDSPLLGDALDVNGLGSGDFAGKTITISYNGTSKTIKLDEMENIFTDTYTGGATWAALTDNEKADAVAASFQKLIDKAFGTAGTGSLIEVTAVALEDEFGSPTGEYALLLEGDTATVNITSNADSLGLTAGMSNRLDTSMTLEEFAEAYGWNLVGDTFRFAVNGVEFEVDMTITVSKLLSNITNSTAGVKAEYDTVSQSFVFTSKTTGGGEGIVIEDLEGNFMSEFIGARAGNYVAGSTVYMGVSETSVTTMDNIINDAILASGATTLQDLADYLETNTMRLTIDGKQVTLNLGFDATDPSLAGINLSALTASDYNAISALITTNLNDQIDDAFGAGTSSSVGFSYDTTTHNLTFTSTDSQNSVQLSSYAPSGSVSVFSDLFGSAAIRNSATTQYGKYVVSDNPINLPYSYDATGATTGGTLSGMYSNPGVYTMNVTVNGVTMTVTVDTATTSLQDLMDTLTIGNDENGNAYTDIQDVYTDIAAQNAILSSTTATQDDKDAAQAEFDRLTTMADNFWSNLDNLVLEDLQTQLNDSLQAEAAAYDALNPGSNISKYAAKLTFAVDEDGYIGLSASDNTVNYSISDDGGGLFGELGFLGSSVQNDQSTMLTDLAGLTFPTAGSPNSGDFTITIGNNTYSVAYYDTDTLQDVINRVNDTVGWDVMFFLDDGSIAIDGGANSMEFADVNGNFLETITGSSSYVTKPATIQNNIVEGTNAVVVIDGQRIVSSSNDISYNGLTITVKDTLNVGYYDEEVLGKTPTTGATTWDSFITITVTADVDAVVDKVKQWIEDYNAVVELLNSYIKDEKSDGYDPLTDEQKAEMTESEITMWETEAKKGILRNDTYLRQIQSDMRSTLYSANSAAGIGIYDLGITTMSSYSNSSYTSLDAGKLVLEDEDKLRDMLTNNPDQVRLLFTDSEEGLAWKLDDVLTNAVNESSTAEGTLVRVAGTTKVTGSEGSLIDKRIEAIDEYIIRLKARLENEYTRYWNQFTALENAMLKYSSQSSYLEGLMSS